MPTSPPSPPSPPEGPPRGTYFSLRKATHPSPPSPAFIDIFASSANTYSPVRRTWKMPENRSDERREIIRQAQGQRQKYAPRRKSQRGAYLKTQKTN